MLSPQLQNALQRLRLASTKAQASQGVGERMSAAKGSGIEFADHRPYHIGDDVRHIDGKAFARWGKLYTKEYQLYQKLPTIVLLDNSLSMHGDASKWEQAQQLALALSYLVLKQHDILQVGLIEGERVYWLKTAWHLSQLATITKALQRPALAAKSLREVFHNSAPHFPPKALSVLISDLWFGDFAEGLKYLALLQQDVVVFHTLSATEIDPSHLGEATRLQDSESGNYVDVALTPERIAAYQQALAKHGDGIREALRYGGGRYQFLCSEDALRDVLLGNCVRAGILEAS